MTRLKKLNFGLLAYAMPVVLTILLVRAVKPWRPKATSSGLASANPSAALSVEKTHTKKQPAPESSSAALLAAVGFRAGNGINDSVEFTRIRGRIEAIIERQPNNPYAFAVLALVCGELGDCVCQKRSAIRAKELALQTEGCGLNLEELEKASQNCP